MAKIGNFKGGVHCAPLRTELVKFKWNAKNYTKLMISCKTIDMQDNFTNMQNYIINMQITLQTCKLRYKHAQNRVIQNIYKLIIVHKLSLSGALIVLGDLLGLLFSKFT